MILFSVSQLTKIIVEKGVKLDFIFDFFLFLFWAGYITNYAPIRTRYLLTKQNNTIKIGPI